MDSEQRARELLAEVERGPINDYGTVHRRTAHEAIRRALEQREAVPALEVFRIAGGDVECCPNPTADQALECLRDLRECYNEALATPPRDVPEWFVADAVNRAIAAVEPMYGERQDTWIARVRGYARDLIAAAPAPGVG